MDQVKKSVKRPAWIWGLTEGYRALMELTTYFPFRLISKIPKDGDSHPVLILPGFMSTDKSTVPLRSFIQKIGYTVYGWGSGRNRGEEELLDEMIRKVEYLFQIHEEQVSLIGWSLGGVFARQIAKARPHMVRQVITLGSPFKGVLESNNATWILELLNKKKKEEISIDPEFLADLPLPAPVPTTAIYSKEDGVVPWRLCMEQVENDIHQNIQVRGSHLGLGINPSVLIVIADRLKLSEKNWIKFIPNGLVEKQFYPNLRTPEKKASNLKIIRNRAQSNNISTQST